jgi:hypothetical protein
MCPAARQAPGDVAPAGVVGGRVEARPVGQAGSLAFPAARAW